MPLGGTVTTVIGYRQQRSNGAAAATIKGQSPRIPHRRLQLGSFLWKRFTRSSSSSSTNGGNGGGSSSSVGVTQAAFVDEGGNNSSPNSTSTNEAVSTSAVFKIRGGVLVASASTDDDADVETSKSSVCWPGSSSSARGEDYDEGEREFFHSEATMTNDDLCSGFESQTWRKDRCKKCFRLKEQHNVSGPGGSGASGSKYAGGGSSGAGNVASRVNKFSDKNGSAVSRRSSTSDANEATSSQTSSSDWRRRVYGTTFSDQPFNGKTPKLTDELPASSASFATMSAANRLQGDAGAKTSPTREDSSTQKRKTKLLLIKAEVSFDGRPSEPVDVETTPTSQEPTIRHNASSPSLSKIISIKQRPTSPQDFSARSGASSAADSYETAPSTVGGGLALAGDPLSRTVSYESVASTLMEVGSMITATSGRSNSLSERSSTPTESLDTDTQSFMRSIKAQLEIMENKCAKLENENAKLRVGSSPLTSISPSDSDVVRELKEKLGLAESLCQDYRDENTVLKCELRDLQELTSRHGNYADLKEWRNKLKAAESLCEELMDENETLKKDVKDSQQEIDEMHDQYREEEIEEFRELQRELEQTAKNCRILQFKLRKSERRHDQTEADRQHLELKLKEFLSSGGAGVMANAANLESPRLRELESELRIAKEVSVRLHNELEGLDEKRCKLEDENFYLKEKVRELETREKLMEQMRVRQELKRTGSGSSTGKSSHVANLNNQNGQDANIMQLLRDLQDALERETDLREQLRFAEEDIQAARKKLADLETENEGLMRQLAKFSGGVGGRGKPPMKRSFSEGHAQIELELAEHEATVLKDRLTRMEKDSEKMVSQISLLEKELKKVGGRTDFVDDELQNAIPDTYYKQKIKMLDEEVEDLKKKLEDARRPESEQRLAQVGVSKSMRNRASTDIGSTHDSSKNVDVQRQLSLVEQEVNVLRQRIADLETDNDRLSSENKRLTINSKKIARSEKSASASPLPSPPSYGDTHGPRAQERIEQMEKDIHRFISRIAELEREKDALNKEIERRKKLETIKKEAAIAPATTAASRFNTNTATIDQLRVKVNELVKENTQLGGVVKGEQQKSVELESQLSDYKQVISQSDDQKLIVMASKVEALTNQLREAQNRTDMINYQNAVAAKNVTVSQTVGERRYEDMLKERVDILERALTEEKAKSKAVTILHKDGSATSGDSSEKEMLTAELSSCHQMLSTVEDQVDRIYKQIEQLEQKQQSDKSPSTQPKAAAVAARQTTTTLAGPATTAAEKEKLLKDITNMKSELDSLRAKLQDRRKLQTSAAAAAAALVAKTPLPNDVKQLQVKCQQQETSVAELKEQLEHANRERVNAQRHSETATTRLLQTEERWNKELEKLKESYENQVKDLKYYLQEAERIKEEKTMLLQDRSSSLQEKTKRNQDLETKASKLEQELKTRHKDLQSAIDTEKKRAKDFETKYQKLEALYESDRQKLNLEKEKFKGDLLDIKKRYDETQNDFEKLKQTYDRKEQIWQKEKQELESQVKQIQTDIGEVEKKTAKKAAEMAGAENRKLLSEMSLLKRRVEADADSWKTERTSLQQSIDQKAKDLEFRLDELERMKKEMSTLKSRVVEQKQQLEEARRMRDEAREELNRWQQTWARERSELSHKLRQEEKVQQAEHQALQLKYESRIKVMEDSAKRIQAQLSQTRRERDNARDNMAAAEKRITESRQKYENDEKELRQRMLRMEKEAQEAEDAKVLLEKERVESKALNKNYETDKRLWNVEREQFLIKISELEKAAGRTRPGGAVRPTVPGQKDEKDKALAEAIDIAVALRKQFGDVKLSYDEEVSHLQKAIETHRRDWSKERNDMLRKLKEVQENVKILEIDRRNFLSVKDQNESDKTALQAERDALMEKLHDSEIHQLANKYKLDKVADQITDLQAKIRYRDAASSEKREISEAIRRALEQLLSVREDMAKTKELGKVFDSIDIPDDAASVSSYRSSNGSRKLSVDVESVERDAAASDLSSIAGKERLAPVGSEAESIRSKSPQKTYGSQKRNDFLMTPGSVSSARSSSGDADRYVGYEARLAELRLRSPSPSPRKITNYPEAPPSMVLKVDSKTAVEYDSSGRRHWTRRSLLKRSTSFDPTAPLDSGLESLAEMDGIDSPTADTSGYPVVRSAQPRSASAGGDGGFLGNKQPPSLAGSESGSELGSARSQSPHRRRATDIFATIRKGATSQAAKAKRGIFGSRKSASIETSEIGHRIGQMGVQVLPPAVAPDNLPDTVRTASETSLDDPPKPISKSTSGSSIFARLRNRSSSRGPLKRQGQSADSDTEAAPSASAGSSVHAQDGVSTKSMPAPQLSTGDSASSSDQRQRGKYITSSSPNPASASASTSVASKYRPSTGDESVLKIKDSLSNSSIRNSFGFRRLSTSYSSVRSLSSKYVHRW